MSKTFSNTRSTYFLINGEQYHLNKNKLFIGSASHCDLIINDESVSDVHAMLFLTEDGFIISDLNSLNGIKFNNITIEQQILSHEDTITIGKTQLLIQIDNHIDTISDVDSSILFIEEINQFTEISSIDESFKFNEDVVNADLLGFKNNHINFDYIDDKSNFNDPRIQSSVNGLSLQITTYCNGVTLDQFYLENDLKSFSVNSKKSKKSISFLPPNQPYELIKREGDQFMINSPEGFSYYQDQEVIENKLGAKAILHKSNLHIIIEVVEAPPELEKTPFFIKDIAFQKELGKVLAATLLPMLLLLFISAPVVEKKKVISIVYKRKSPVKSQHNEFKSEKVTKKNTGNVAKTNLLKPKKSQVKPKKVAMKKPITKKRKPNKKLASKLKPKAAPIKTYKFNSPTNLKSVFNTSKIADIKFDDISSSDISADSQEKSIDISNDRAGSRSPASLSGGTSESAYGVKGLSGGKGHQMAHIESKTVVLGSMDPELLRKILQEYIPQFRHCYQKELNEQSDSIKGIIDLNFTINGNGSITGIDIKSKRSRFSNNGIDCMASVLKVINFPKPKGGGIVDIKQPLNFYSESKTI
jgi:hypothetical protein